MAVVLVPLLGREFSPDTWVESTHREAAESFAREGFVAHRFSPYVQLTPLDETPPAYRVYYTRTQQLSFILYGWLTGLGFDSLVAWRLLAMLLTMAGVLAYYAMLRAGDVPRDAAGLSTLALAWTPALLAWGHSFTLIYCSMPLLTFGSIALWLRYGRRPGHPWVKLALWVLLLLQGLTTQHTYMITTQLFFWTYAILERRWSWTRALVWLTPHLGALGVIVMKNAWLLGGLGPALVDDILAKIAWRTVNIVTPGAANSAYPFEWSHFRRVVYDQLRWSGALLAGLVWLGLWEFRVREAKQALTGPVRRMVIALLVPGAIYAVVFFQEVYIHIFHSRNLIAGAALLAGAGGACLLRWVSTAGRTPKAIVASVAVLALGLQLHYAWEKAEVTHPWVEDAKQLSTQIADESDLLLCAATDWYPVHPILGKPFVFPRPAEQRIGTHAWWLMTEPREVDELGATVRELWPGHRIGLIVPVDHPFTNGLRDGLRGRRWLPRWSGSVFEIYVLPEVGEDGTGKPARERAPDPPTGS